MIYLIIIIEILVIVAVAVIVVESHVNCIGSPLCAWAGLRVNKAGKNRSQFQSQRLERDLFLGQG